MIGRVPRKGLFHQVVVIGVTKALFPWVVNVGRLRVCTVGRGGFRGGDLRNDHNLWLCRDCFVAVVREYGQVFTGNRDCVVEFHTGILML